MKEYFVETWEAPEIELAKFTSEEKRWEWVKGNCYQKNGGWYLKSDGARIAFCEW